MRKLLILICCSVFLIIPVFVFGQPKPKFLEINMVPGLGTTGIDPENSTNLISLNVFSGYSSETRVLQISGISSLNVFYSGGLHIASIANLTGINLPYTDDDELKEMVDMVMLEGIQIAGFMNFVRGHTEGAQISGFSGITQKETIGVQISGVASLTAHYLFGIQISGLINSALWSVTGTQIAGLANYSNGELEGLQLAPVNIAGTLEGKNSMLEGTTITGFQIGLINKARKMNGFQIGIINLGGSMRGTQIGLVNFGNARGRSNRRNGTMIGLLNFGNSTNLGIFANEIFLMNIELSTGTLKNGSISQEIKNKYLLNTISYSRYPLYSISSNTWAIGYGLSKLFFNRSSIPELSEKYMRGLGIYYHHIISDSGAFWNHHELFQLKGGLGVKAFKRTGIYCVARLSLNFQFKGKEGAKTTPDFAAKTNISNSSSFSFWPGLSIGFMAH